MRAVEIGRVMPKDVILSRHELYVPGQDFELLAWLQKGRFRMAVDWFRLYVVRMESTEPNQHQKHPRHDGQENEQTP